MPGFTKTLSYALTVAATSNGISTAQSPGAAGNLTITGSLASGGTASLTNARRVQISSSGTESNKTFTVYGTDRYGRSQSEAITGPVSGTPVWTTKDFLTVTRVAISAASAGSITVGTNGIGSIHPWVVDAFAGPAQFGYTVVDSGGAGYLLEYAVDDLAPLWDLANNDPTWATAVDGSGATGQAGFLEQPCTMLRLTITSGTTTVTARFVQTFLAGAA